MRRTGSHNQNIQSDTTDSDSSALISTSFFINDRGLGAPQKDGNQYFNKRTGDQTGGLSIGLSLVLILLVQRLICLNVLDR